MIIDKIINLLNKKDKIIKMIFPEGWNPNIQKAAIELRQKGMIEPILIFNDKNEVPMGLCDIKSVVISEIDVDSYAQELVEIRKNKGLSLSDAKNLVTKPNYLASLMIKLGEADAEICGIEYTTKNTLVPALQILKTKPGYKLVSSCFIMEKNDEVLLFGDCAINLEPNAIQLKEITKGIIEFGNNILNFSEARTALLSYSTNGSGAGDTVDVVKEAIKLLKKEKLANNVRVYGEIQFDAAYNMNIMNKKAKDLVWTKPANIFIFPNLNAGNIGYKIAQRMGGYQAIGPVLLGLGAPVNDLSRGASTKDVIALSYITAMQCFS